MSDDRLRRAEQEALEAGPFSIEHWRLRVEFIRAGRAEEAGFGPGDKVEVVVDLIGTLGERDILTGTKATIIESGSRDGEGQPLYTITDGRAEFCVNADKFKLVEAGPFKVVPPCEYAVKTEAMKVGLWACYHANRRVHLLHESMNDKPYRPYQPAPGNRGPEIES